MGGSLVKQVVFGCISLRNHGIPLVLGVRKDFRWGRILTHTPMKKLNWSRTPPDLNLELVQLFFPKARHPKCCTQFEGVLFPTRFMFVLKSLLRPCRAAPFFPMHPFGLPDFTHLFALFGLLHFLVQPAKLSVAILFGSLIQKLTGSLKKTEEPLLTVYRFCADP